MLLQELHITKLKPTLSYSEKMPYFLTLIFPTSQAYSRWLGMPLQKAQVGCIKEKFNKMYFRSKICLTERRGNLHSLKTTSLNDSNNETTLLYP